MVARIRAHWMMPAKRQSAESMSKNLRALKPRLPIRNMWLRPPLRCLHGPWTACIGQMVAGWRQQTVDADSFGRAAWFRDRIGSLDEDGNQRSLVLSANDEWLGAAKLRLLALIITQPFTLLKRTPQVPNKPPDSQRQPKLRKCTLTTLRVNGACKHHFFRATLTEIVD